MIFPLLKTSLNSFCGDFRHRLNVSENAGVFLVPIFMDFIQIRGRKRGLKRPLSREEKLARRLKREEKEAKKKQYSFMERINIRRMQRLLSPSQQFPGRYEADKETNLKSDIPYDVFVRSQHKTQFYSIQEALAMHRLLQSEALYNRPDAKLKLRIELNMTTDKSTKMVSDSEEIVPIPYSFEHKEKRTILAFASEKEQQDLAILSGAEIAVGQDIVKKILKGLFIITDYDFCVAHTDMASSIIPLRGLLRSKFPTLNNGALGSDLGQILKRFLAGSRLSIKGDPVHPTWGLADPIIGRLNMPDDQLEANMAEIITYLCKHRSPALGPFINRAVLMTLPGTAHFAIDVSKYVPEVTEEDLEKLQKRKKKKKAKKVVEKDETPKDEILNDPLLALM